MTTEEGLLRTVLHEAADEVTPREGQAARLQALLRERDQAPRPSVNRRRCAGAGIGVAVLVAGCAIAAVVVGHLESRAAPGSADRPGPTTSADPACTAYLSYVRTGVYQRPPNLEWVRTEFRATAIGPAGCTIRTFPRIHLKLANGRKFTGTPNDPVPVVAPDPWNRRAYVIPRGDSFTFSILWFSPVIGGKSSAGIQRCLSPSPLAAFRIKIDPTGRYITVPVPRHTICIWDAMYVTPLTKTSR